MKIGIRSDASVKSGAGHVMRCLALAQLLRENKHDVFFISAEINDKIRKLVSDSGFEVVELDAVPGSAEDLSIALADLKKMDADWVVLDGYHFDIDYQRGIKNAGFKLLFIDDYGQNEHYYADLVLNQNIYADKSYYPSREPDVRLLLGTDFALLRQEFKPYLDWQRSIPEVAKNVLITLGGSDPENVTMEIIELFEKLEIDGLKLKVTAGGSNPNVDLLRKKLEESKLDGELLINVTNMPELMAEADIAFTAGGSTCWELMFMKLPALITVLADNQRPVAETLRKKGVIGGVIEKSELNETSTIEFVRKFIKDKELRQEISRKAGKTVDGYGSQRVLKEMECPGLRPVQESDCDFVLELSNQPEVRKVSFSPEPISREEHCAWFDRMLKNGESFFYIIEEQDTRQPAGQIRFKIEDKDAVISLSLSRSIRGKCYASMLIEKASNRMFAESSAELIHAYIQHDNEASIRCFSRAGYEEIKDTDDRLHFILRRSR